MDDWQDVYAGLGLATAWNTINGLLALTGPSTSRGRNANIGWSLHEIHDILGTCVHCFA